MNSFKHRWYQVRGHDVADTWGVDSVSRSLRGTAWTRVEDLQKKITVASTPGRFGTMHGMKTY